MSYFYPFYNRSGDKAPGYLSSRNLQGNNQQSSSGVSMSASRAVSRNGARLGDALVIGDRLRQFNSMMAIRDFCISFVAFICSVGALGRWHQYELSARYTWRMFGMRLIVTAGVTYLPWYWMIFPEDEDLCVSGPDFCRSVLTPARMMMDFK